MMNGISSSSFMQRPDPSQLANSLFSKLDGKNKGYLEKSDLQTAFSTMSSGDSSGAPSVDDVFSKLDADGDGKVTKDEMSSSIKKLADELDAQFNQMRTQGGTHNAGGQPPAGGMPPPGGMPPGGAQGAGQTKEELQSTLSSISKSNSAASEKLSNLVQNFEKADTDKDGKVSAQEAFAYDQAQAAKEGKSSDSSQVGSSESEIMKRIMQLVHAYGQSDSTGFESNNRSSFSTVA